ncbi:hypothetical protein L7F22_020767 [Adiantum nelumboides]|nr:hypothetical protein [Adiantum nelumboides]
MTRTVQEKAQVQQPPEQEIQIESEDEEEEDKDEEDEEEEDEEDEDDDGDDDEGFPETGPAPTTEGNWVFDREREPLYGEACPFHRNAWNCEKNKRPGLDDIYKWKWVPHSCSLSATEPTRFLSSFQNMNLGFVGDSLNENLLVSLLCILASADPGARRWKKRKAWRGAYFPKYNVTVGYHRAVLLADYHE